MPADDGKQPTMADVAAAAGVSAMTVSYTYNRPERVAEATREHVLSVARRLGYAGPHPTAKSLRQGRTGVLAVLIGEPLRYAFADPQAARFLAGVADVCREDGAALTLVPTSGDPGDADIVRRTACDGWIVWTTAAHDPALQAAVASRKPVAVHGGPRTRGTLLVTIDDRQAAAAATAAAFAGARRPAVVSFPTGPDRHARLMPGIDPAQAEFPVTRHRLEGVADHCSSARIDPAGVPVAVVSRNDRLEARATVSALFDRYRPDAVMAMSDELALTVLDEARRRRVGVPGRLSVTGWDDSPAASAAGLTTVAQSLEQQGRQCALIALGRRRTSVRAGWSLITRTSTRSAPPPDSEPPARAVE